MYTPTVNKKYRQFKEKKEKILKARDLSAKGKPIYEIARELKMTEFEVVRALE